MVTDLPADWKPEPFKGQTIDLGVPEAKQWAQHEVERIVTDYHLDMLEHDGYLVAQDAIAPIIPTPLPIRSTKCIYKTWGSYFVDQLQFHRRELPRGARLLRHLFEDAARAPRAAVRNLQ